MSYILLLDENNNTRTELANMLQGEISAGFLEATTAETAQQLCADHQVSVLFMCLSPDEHKSISAFKHLRNNCSRTVMVLIVPEYSSASAKEILHSGADFFLHAPFTGKEVAQVAQRAFQQHLLQKSASPAENSDNELAGIIGTSQAMLNLFTLIRRLGQDGDSTVLIQGESGTGKELVAKALHLCSPRRQNNFVPINCAAIPAELLESELFGYEKGAFTGAVSNKKGRLQYAHGGTLFLDEIGDMNPALQAKLLRVIQEQEFEPVGSVKSVKVDVRFVAATHRDLDDAVAKGGFREDLYYRLNVVPVEIPPLRERSDDVPVLLERFTTRFCSSKHRNIFTYSPESLQCLTRYSWPGNVRELENLVQRLSILHMGDIVYPEDLPERYCQCDNAATDNDSINTGSGTDFNSRVSEFEDRLILQALMQAGGNKKEAAELLNLKRTTLLEKIKKKQLDKALRNIK